MKKEKSKSQKTILWVDDDFFFLAAEAELLRDFSGWEVIEMSKAEVALDYLRSGRNAISAVILDIMMPVKESIDLIESRGGFATGKVLARKIRDLIPDIPILGISQSHECREWFLTQNRMSFLPKSSAITARIINEINDLLQNRLKSRIFIVHGHDEQLKLELKNFLQNKLNLGEPIILHEQPDYNLTIIEKFEYNTATIDLVFVLLTPDDHLLDVSNLSSENYRARQNVIFELGYFLGRFGRESGRVILLHRGTLDLPTDISGILYIDISKGITASGESIRRAISLIQSRKIT
jgi:predicted nucleotide-binding protein